MSMLSALLGQKNPFATWAGDNSNLLTGVGSALLSSGMNFQNVPQAAAMDTEAKRQREAEALVTAQKNQTQTWLQKYHPDKWMKVQAGMPLADAYNLALQDEQPKAAPEGFTLGAGQTRYDGFNKPVAYGAEETPQTVISNNVGATDEFYGALDKNLATQTGDLINAGINARSNAGRIGQLETLLKTAPQGAVGGMTQLAGQIGIPTAGLDEVQAAQALINQLVPQQRPPGAGTMSDADLDLYKKSLPQIINQPGGNALIIQTMKAINEYTIAQSDIAQKIANREISPAEGRAMQAQVPNPLEGISANMGSADPAASDPLGLR